MIHFIEDHRAVFGVEPICRVLPIAPSTFYAHEAVRRNPELASKRLRRDAQLKDEIRRVWEENHEVYGARKVWQALLREQLSVARCTVERLMKAMGIQGAVRGQPVITTNQNTALPCPEDKVNREFCALRPNQLWVSDFTYVPTRRGTAYVALITDVFARRIVGWKVATSMTTPLVLDALEQAIHQRCPGETDALIHHSDRGSQYLSIRYTERLAEAGIDASVGSAGDSYDNALAETMFRLFKTEVVNRIGPWGSWRELE